MVEYSEHYHASASATPDGDDWTTDSRGEFSVGIPPEFSGDFDGPAPENYGESRRKPRRSRRG
jgi:hypothetical protein